MQPQVRNLANRVYQDDGTSRLTKWMDAEPNPFAHDARYYMRDHEARLRWRVKYGVLSQSWLLQYKVDHGNG